MYPIVSFRCFIILFTILPYAPFVFSHNDINPFKKTHEKNILLACNVDNVNNEEKINIQNIQNHYKQHPLLEQKTIQLKTRDGLTRNGILTLRKQAIGNVVMCHPAAYHKEFLEPFEEHIFSQYNCLRFDFRRHGEQSENQYTTLGRKEIHEIESAVDIFKKNKNIHHLPLFGFGISMGASILIEAESRFQYFDGLILQAPFDSIRQQAKRMYTFFNIPLMDTLVFSPLSRFYTKKWYNVKLHRVKPIESIKTVTVPIFLIHAKDDPTVSFKAFKRFKQVGKSICKTWTPETGRHTELFKKKMQTYVKKCKNFLNKVLQKTTTIVTSITKQTKQALEKHVSPTAPLERTSIHCNQDNHYNREIITITNKESI